MKVAELAQRLAVTPDTVRFYTRNGFLKPEKNSQNGYREYGEGDYRRLRFILSARQLGFSVDDISQLLGEADAGKAPCPVARQLIERRLHEVEQRFEDTARLLERMRAAAKEWRQQPDHKPTGQMICHLIENFVPAQDG